MGEWEVVAWERSRYKSDYRGQVETLTVWLRTEGVFRTRRRKLHFEVGTTDGLRVYPSRGCFTWRSARKWYARIPPEIMAKLDEEGP